MSSFYTSNNEAFSSLVVLLFLNESQFVSIEKFVLVLPFALNDQILNILETKDDIRDYETFVLDNPRVFRGFNSWFNNLLPISINSFHILKTLRYLDLLDGNVTLEKIFIYNDIDDFGDRLRKIKKVIPYIVEWLETVDSFNLYNDLNIEL